MLKKIILITFFAFVNNANSAQANNINMLNIAPVTQEDFASLEDKQCPICLEGMKVDFENKEVNTLWPYKTGCNHIFHKSCIAQWCNSGFNTCAKCRTSILRPSVQNWFEFVRTGSIDNVGILIENGININIQDNAGNTALAIASSRGYENIVRILIENHADLNIQDNAGWTALMNASLHGYENIVQLLVENHANADIQNNAGWTALMYASRNGHENIVQLLMMQELPHGLVE